VPAPIASVVVSETAAGTLVTISDHQGRRVSRPAARSRRFEAIAEAVGAMLGLETAVHLVDVERRDDAVLVVVELGDGTRRAGAAMRRSGWNHAVAEAVWVALRPS
jgi:hypothetical protein